MESNNSQNDYWIVKVDAGGILEWQASLGGSYIDACFSVVATSDGGYVVTGSASSNDGDVLNNHSGAVGDLG